MRKWLKWLYTPYQLGCSIEVVPPYGPCLEALLKIQVEAHPAHVEQIQQDLEEYFRGYGFAEKTAVPAAKKIDLDTIIRTLEAAGLRVFMASDLQNKTRHSAAIERTRNELQDGGADG